ncbi:MAG: hypothetical protein FWE20_08760 [Defluviitaleaceae bacterium]|nr:hypothetical protein [Defluviitaleaceae bacterium]
MKIEYNLTADECASLADAISQELEAPINRINTSTVAYEVGGYLIDNNGTVTGEDNRDLVADLCGLHSFRAVSEGYEEYPDIDRHYQNQPVYENFWLTEREELGLGRERRDHPGEDGMLASDVPEPDHIIAPDDDYYRSSSDSTPERGVIFRETYTYTDRADQKVSETIEYPAPTELIHRFMLKAGFGGGQDVSVVMEAWESVIPGIYDYLPPSGNFDEINYLAKQIQALSPGERDKLTAALETGRFYDTDEIINLTANLVNFQLTPADKATNADMQVDGISEDSSQSYFIAKGLEGNPTLADMQNGIITSKGLLSLNDELTSPFLTKPYRFYGDIPKAERASAFLDRYNVPEVQSVFKQVELSTIVLQLHALFGDHLADAPKNLATLDVMHFSEFLLLIDKQGAFLTAASHAYREGTPAYDRIMGAEDSHLTNLFALHVTDIWTAREPSGESARGPIIGDLAEVELLSQQFDIQLNAVTPTIINGERHFADADYSAVRKHLEHISGSHQLLDGPVLTDASETFPRFNHFYMEEVMENPEHDAIRIPNQAAREMLARNDAPIHLITEQGVKSENLSQLDVLRILKFGKENAFAIKTEDLPGFEKWAKRTAPEMVRQVQAKDKERGEQKKSQGEEL